MKRTLPVALIFALSACQPPGGNTEGNRPRATTLEAKAERIEQMAKALSMADNPELKKAGESMQRMGTTMSQGEFAKVSTMVTAGGSNLVAAGGGNIVAAGGGNMVTAGGSNMVTAGGSNVVAAGGGNVTTNGRNFALATAPARFQSALRQDIYRLLGEATVNQAVVTWDDETGELTGIRDANTDMTFAFQNKGDTRIWTLALNKSADGSTGTVTISITASRWNPIPPEQTYGQIPVRPTQPSDQDWWGDQGQYPNEDGFVQDQSEGDWQGNGESAPESDGEWTDSSWQDEESFYKAKGYKIAQVGPASGIKLFGNELPDLGTVTDASLTFDVKPQNDDALRIKMGVGIAGFEPSATGRFPTRLTLSLTVPSIKLDVDTGFKNNVLALAGHLNVRTTGGIENFSYQGDSHLDTGAAKLDLTNENAGVRFHSVTAAKDRNGEPGQNTVTLFDTADGKQIGTMGPHPTNMAIARFTFTNGKTVDWNLGVNVTGQPDDATNEGSGRSFGQNAGTSGLSGGLFGNLIQGN